VSQAEESKISDITNREDKGQNRPVIEWLRRHPSEAPFLVTDDRSWSYGETIAEVEKRIADDWVEVAPRLDPESVFSILAGLSGGGTVVLPPARITNEGRSVDGLPSAGNDTILVVFTSGSTGHARGVRLTRDNLEAAARASVGHLGHGPVDQWLLCLPLFHVGGLSILVRSAFAGGSVRLLESFDPRSAADALHGDVTVASMVPTMLSRTLDVDEGPYPGIRWMILGGGPIPGGLLDRAYRAGIPALPSYGMTETFGQVATLKPGSSPESRAHPLPGVDLRLGPDGRIAVAGAQVSPGYLGEPNRDDRWLLTNDLGVIDEEGAVRVLGRADAVIVSGGENIEPAPVEAALSAHPGVEEAVVVGIPDDEWGSLVCCVYQGRAAVDELESFLRETFPAHHVPKRWLQVEALPLTGLGKPDRAESARLVTDA
jgi:o-succinylbenzoate---CoA ligase